MTPKLIRNLLTKKMEKLAAMKQAMEAEIAAVEAWKSEAAYDVESEYDADEMTSEIEGLLEDLSESTEEAVCQL